MRTLVLPLLLATSASAAEPSSGGAITHPDWISLPSAKAFEAVLSAEAVRKGRDGRATIECSVTAQGALEGCKVISETPPGLGFGTSALLLAPSFAMKPALENGHPVSGTVRIPIVFKLPGITTRQETRPIVSDAVWEAAPTFADMAGAWPRASKVDVAHVSLRCHVTAQGTLAHCEVMTEAPLGQGFGDAARIMLAPKFRLRVDPKNPRFGQAWINVPIHFNNPASNAPRAVVQPKWITTLNPGKVLAIFPSKAADAGVTQGHGVADCLIAPDGRLTDCKPAPATPEGLGFSEAAVQVASVMQMNPWTDGGGPVDGARIRLPIAFNLAPDPPTPAKP